MTNQSKHTSGPWDIHGDFREIHELHDSDGVRTLADVDPDNLMPGAERAANARLIAAAPELLEALYNMVISAVPGMNWTDESGQLMIRNARAAIAKARGE